MRFIHFGCWNNIHSGLEENMDSIQKFLKLPSSKKNPIDFFSIAGDNYYPKKDKSEKKNKGEKTIVEDDLRAGFNLLPVDDKNKFVILGNHDLETNMKFISSSGKETYDDSCKILELEKEITDEREDTFLNLFKFLFDDESKTLIIFLDTTMYVNAEDFEKYQACYRKLPIPVSSTKSSNYQDRLIEYQNNAIIKYISQRRAIDKLVIIGHHPLIYLKNKEGKIKAKQDIPNIMSLLSSIFETCPTSDFFYLCADLHLYQEGEVTFQDKIIKQYIVGTGGTKLDDEIPKDYNDKKYEMGEISYKHIKSIHDYGFLDCNFPIDTPPTFGFHSKSFSTPPSRRRSSVPRSLSPTSKKIPSRHSVSPSKGGKRNKTRRKYTRRRRKN